MRQVMIVKVLGSAAGGGFPQWNCNCRNCASVRAGAPGFAARTQCSLAVSADGRDWVLLNTSPDFGVQIERTPALTPDRDQGVRHSPIKAVVLTGGDVDQIAGLINLREDQPLAVVATSRVLDMLAANAIFNVLATGVVERQVLPVGSPLALAGAGRDLGLTIEAFDVPGKIALYLEDDGAGPDLGTRPGDTIGVKVVARRTGRSFFFIPGCAGLDQSLAGHLRGADLVFFDGTLYTDDELITQGLLAKTGRRMGHLSMSGPEGSMAAFADLGVRRRVYIHINNSNPVLDERSGERAAVEAAGWQVARDGMEVRL